MKRVVAFFLTFLLICGASAPVITCADPGDGSSSGEAQEDVSVPGEKKLSGPASGTLVIVLVLAFFFGPSLAIYVVYSVVTTARKRKRREGKNRP